MLVVASMVGTGVFTTTGFLVRDIGSSPAVMACWVLGGLLAMAVILHRLPEGWTEFVAYGTEHGKFQLFDFQWSLSEPYTIWAGVLGGMFLTLGTHGTDQMMVQRYLCARSQRDAGRALVASGFVVLVQFALFLLLGVGLACFYDHILPGTVFEKGDHVFATFIVQELPFNVGIIGLLLAAVFAAAMSTLSSSLNSSASAAVNDFYIPLRRSELSSSHLVGVSRLFTIVFGVIQIAIGIVAESFSGSVVADALAIAGFSAGLLLGLFFLGVLTKRVDQTAALVGLIVGLIVLCVAKFVAPEFGVVIAWPWFALIGLVATFSVGYLASFLTRQNDRT